ncbi:hypothetical protein WDU94_000826 [Cyamophila willieti]
MDVNSAFYQQPIAPADRKYTALTTQTRFVEFKRLPFGLKLSPAIFNRALSRVFSNLLYHGVLLYLDDIVTYQSDFQSALDLLRQTFERIRSAKLKLKTTKCHFFYNKIEILGHEISQVGIRPLTKNVEVIQKFEIPKTQKQLRSFIGAVSFYRKFIPNLSTIVSPLTDLTRKEFEKKKLPWCQIHTEAFLKVKQLLINPPLLAYYKQGKETIVYTDASYTGIGGALHQINEKGESHPIAYVSRRLQKNELNYSASEVELLSIVYCVTYWRQYLYGIQFKVINDHASLRYFKNVKNNNTRLGRLSFKLIDYDLEILHKKNLTFVDYLSRHPVDEVVSEEELDRQDYLHSFHIEKVNLELLQREDELLGEIYKICLDPNYPASRNTQRASRRYCIDSSDNLLYYKKFTPEGQKLLVAIPKSLQSKLLTMAHENLETGCHLGSAKILSLLSNRYYWPSMVQDLTYLIKTCKGCQLRKAPKSAPKGLLHPVPIPSKPFTTVVIDYLGPLHKSSSKEYIIVATDPTTKFAFAKATTKADANTTMNFIIDICTLFGIPRTIQTDRGSHFTSQVVEQLLKGLNITHGLAPAYRPQAQGITERFNSTICDMLSHFVDTDGKKWDQYVNWVCHVYNSTKHASTNQSPFYLLHGYEPRSTIDLTLLPSDTEHDVLQALEILDNVRSQLPKLLSSVQQKNKDRYDRTHIFESFNIGDEVLVYDPTYKTKSQGKFENRYKGPYKKLCGTTWGSSTSVLRISALALVYSAAEYCAPVWINSVHTNLVDVQLNNTMRIITGAIRPTPVHWLPVLSHIPPPHLKRKAHLLREYNKLKENRDLPIHTDTNDTKITRLKSRNPPLVTADSLLENDFDVTSSWRQIWEEAGDDTMRKLPCIEENPPGQNLPRKTWVTLNRIRTNVGKCADMMNKWGIHPSPECTRCGAPKQTVAHIVHDCPTTLYPGDAQDFIFASDEAVAYINNTRLCI